MNKLIILLLLLFSACAASNDPGASKDDFDASICNQIPVGVEKAAAMDPNNPAFKISCADLARCTSIMGWSAPPDVPCQ